MGRRLAIQGVANAIGDARDVSALMESDRRRVGPMAVEDRAEAVDDAVAEAGVWRREAERGPGGVAVVGRVHVRPSAEADIKATAPAQAS
jgi:hypothetical protein